LRPIWEVKKACISFIITCLSVCPHVSTRLPLDGVSWN